MIKIDAQGRLAAQPELKFLRQDMKVCEFRLLSNRWAKGQEFTEAVTMFCFGDDAERFCELTEKGQEISATGVQETSRYKDSAGVERVIVKYRMTWWQGGRKPYRANAQSQRGQQDQQWQRQASNSGGYQNAAQPQQANHQSRNGGGDGQQAPYYANDGEQEHDGGHGGERNFPPDDQFL